MIECSVSLIVEENIQLFILPNPWNTPVKLNQGQREWLWIKTLATKPDDPISVPKIHMRERGKQLLQVVL